MKLKIDKKTIETILWLLGQLITLIRKISEDNKGDNVAKNCDKIAADLNKLKFSFAALKNLI